MGGLDAGRIIDHGASYDSSTFLFTVFLTFCGIIGLLFVWKIVIPNSKRQMDCIERNTKTNEEHAANCEKFATVLEDLADTAAIAHQRADSRAMTFSAGQARIARCADRLCTAIENLAEQHGKGHAVQGALAVVRSELQQIAESHENDS